MDRNRKEEELKSAAADQVKNRRKRGGYIVRHKNPSQLKSPSTVSTTSLAQLRVRLEQMPHYIHDKDPVSVCAEPILSCITEKSVEDAQSIRNSLRSFKAKHCGVFQRDIIKHTKSNVITKCLSPIVDDENSTSFLLAATLGTADQSINDAVEKITKSKSSNSDNNIVDLLIAEALRSNNEKKEISDSSKIIDKKCTQSNDSKDSNSKVIENTQVKELDLELAVINTGSKTKRAFRNLKNNKKNIGTSSESSDNFSKKQYQAKTSVFEVNEIDIIECLDSIINTICSNFDICTQYLDKLKPVEKTKHDKNRHEKITLSQSSSIDHEVQKEPQSKIYKKAIQKLFTVTNKVEENSDGNKRLKMTKEKLSGPPRMEIELKKRFNHNDNVENPVEARTGTTENNPLNVLPLNLQKKRKSYSPKDDQNNVDKVAHLGAQMEQDTALFEFSKVINVTPNRNTYKKIINERQKHNQRSRTPKTNRILTSYSRNNKADLIFDKLKDDCSNDQPVKFINMRLFKKKLAVYNCESDDEDFIEQTTKKFLTSTRMTTVKATKSQRGRAIYSIDNFEDKDNVTIRNGPSKIKTERNVVNGRNRKTLSSKKVNRSLIEKNIGNASPNILNTFKNFSYKNLEPITALLDKRIESPLSDLVTEKSQTDIKDINDNNFTNRHKPRKITNKKRNVINGRNYKPLSVKKVNKSSIVETIKNAAPDNILNTSENMRNKNLEPITAVTIMIDSDKKTESPLSGLVIQKPQIDIKYINDNNFINIHEPRKITNKERNLVNGSNYKSLSVKKVKKNSIVKTITNAGLDNILNISENMRNKNLDPITTVTTMIDSDKSTESPLSGLVFNNKEQTDSEDVNDSLTLNISKKVKAISKARKSDPITESPLPGLVIKNAQLDSKDINDSSPLNMIEKRKKFSKYRSASKKEKISQIHFNIIRNNESFLNVVSEPLKRRSLISPLRFACFSLPELCVPTVRARPTTNDDTTELNQEIPKLDDKIDENTDINNKSKRNSLEINEIEIKRNKDDSEKKIDKRIDSRGGLIEIVGSVRSDDSTIRRSPETNKENSEEDGAIDRDEHVESCIYSREAMSNTVDSIRKHAQEIVYNVVQKVDKMLTDSNQTAYQRLIQYYIDCDKQIQEIENKLHDLHKQSCRDILTEFCKFLEMKFSELDKKCKDDIDALRKQIKINILKLVEKDVERRQAVVVILGEDVKRALEYLENTA